MRATSLFALVSVLVLATPIARADEGPKDPDAAFWLSMGGSLASIGLAGVGAALSIAKTNNCSGYNCPTNTHQGLRSAGNAMLITGVLTSAFTPLLGEWYSHKFLSAGLGLRIAGAAVFGIGTFHFCGVDANEYGCDASNNNGLLALGAIMYGSGVVYDIATAKGAARRYNGEHATPRAVIVPTALRGASSTGYGVAVGGSF